MLSNNWGEEEGRACMRGDSETECDISVSKLLGFETFPFFFMVSVSKNFGIDKSIGIGFGIIWY